MGDAPSVADLAQDVSRWTDDSLTWSARLLDETGVAVAPGVDVGVGVADPLRDL